MAKIQFSKEDLQKIKTSYESGATLTELGVQFSVHRKVIRRIVNEMGILRDKKISIDDHRKRLAEFNKVELAGEWIDTQTKTLYKCLKHNEIHPAYPGNVTKGLGLQCCFAEGQEKQKKQQLKDAALTYDAKIKEVSEGQITRVDEYIGSHTPITHYCHKHQESHKSRPGNVLSGYGLKCCRIAWSKEQAVNRNEKARDSYDKKLTDRSDGRFKRLDYYIDATTPILHYCNIHKEEHNAIPNKLLNGDGMKCCNTGVGWDTLENMLEHKSLSTELNEPCQFYIFEVPETNDCVKIGIAKNSRRRSQIPASRDLYGDVVEIWQCSNRRNAILMETAILRDPSLEYPIQLVENLVYNAGKTEVRRTDIDALQSYVQTLFESIEDPENDWRIWALERIPKLRKWEISALNKSD